MKTGIFLVLIGMLALSCSPSPKSEMPGHSESAMTSSIGDSVRDGIFIHITQGYKDPHRVLMPLRMAVMMAEDKDVLVYMDINSVELLVKGAKDVTHPEFESAQTYLKKLIEKKITVYACPTCLKIAGFKPEDLMDGIQVANKNGFFNFTKGRILTMDY